MPLIFIYFSFFLELFIFMLVFLVSLLFSLLNISLFNSYLISFYLFCLFYIYPILPFIPGGDSDPAGEAVYPLHRALLSSVGGEN